MTCIVAIELDGKVWIGGDSAGTSGWEVEKRADSKVFKNKDMIFGFTSSFRMGQLLRYKFDPPEFNNNKSLIEYMITDFIDSLRECFNSNGIGRNESGVESCGEFIVGFKGKIFRVCSDYQVAESIAQYSACGAGRDIAIGVLHALINAGISPEDIILKALECVAEKNGSVTGPFNIVSN